jgi:hypothetical protein
MEPLRDVEPDYMKAKTMKRKDKADWARPALLERFFIKYQLAS